MAVVAAEALAILVMELLTVEAAEPVGLMEMLADRVRKALAAVVTQT